MLFKAFLVESRMFFLSTKSTSYILASPEHQQSRYWPVSFGIFQLRISRRDSTECIREYIIAYRLLRPCRICKLGDEEDSSCWQYSQRKSKSHHLQMKSAVHTKHEDSLTIKSLSKESEWPQLHSNKSQPSVDLVHFSLHNSPTDIYTVQTSSTVCLGTPFTDQLIHHWD